jgi:CheY-like chemotaxis protein
MSAEQLRRLFNPFDRLGLEGSAIEGTGIGLVITRHLVELMHGTIEATSEAGAGTTFTVALPLAAAGSAPAATPQARPEPEPALVPAAPAAAAPAVTVTPQPRPRVLYIEDNEVNAQLMRAVFRQRPGVELCIARNIATGMEMLRERRPRLLLLDMHLPDGNGSDLLDAMAADAVLRQVPVVAVSADATWAQVQAAMGSGIRAYLTKPIDVREVLATVDRVLAAGAPETGAGAAR